MANTIEYIFSLQDKISAKIGNITVTSDRMLGKFSDLEKKTNSVTKTFNETGRSLGSLREKIALLQAEREWIPAENIEGIRAYNREMKALTKEVNKLESLNGGKFKKWGKEAFAAMPGSNLIANPLVAGAAAVGFAGKSAMNFDEGMAKVNITAQLDEKGLTDLKTRLKQVVKDNKADIDIAPVGMEKIISQVGDADLSMQILDASLKGSKAGFTELDTVSGALAQSLSIIGKENTNAKEVLDTFFAAKRVGAGEFNDFARYMPGLIAGASNMGINFKEVAGTFAYMTGKGQSAERAAVLMENAFSVLGKADVRGKMEKAGINVFDDQGKMRGMVDIFTDMSGVLSGMTDEQKSSILESFGLTDKEAKNAFAIMTSDLGKLQEAMDATANSTGETEKAMAFSENSVQKATEVWNQFKGIGLNLGEAILPMIGAGLSVVGVVLDSVCMVLETVNSLFSWWFGLLQTGNPLVWGITAAVGALSAALLIHHARIHAVWILTKAKVVWDGIQTAATWAQTAAQWALNAAFLACPLTWIVIAIGAVVAAVVACWNNFEGFRKVVMGCWEVIKEFGSVLINAIVDPFKQVLKGLSSVGDALVHLIKGDFSEAKEAAAQGIKDIAMGSAKMSPIGIGVQVAKNGNYNDAFAKGKQKGADSWKASQEEDNKPNTVDALIPTAPATAISTFNFAELQKKLNQKGKGTGQSKQVLNLNEPIQDYKESSDYTAVTKKIAPVTVDLIPTTDKLIASNAPASKVVDARDRFAHGAKADESKQEYVPSKTNLLQDIMLNVRKIAAVGAIPLAINLTSVPTEAKTPAVNLPEMGSIAMPSPEVYDIERSEKTMERTSEVKTETVYESGRRMQIDRICDQIVIHVQNMDGKGKEEIRTDILNVLNELLEV
ncbi:MAG: phage tail tape measure protein [Tannerellaceae bacterium]